MEYNSGTPELRTRNLCFRVTRIQVSPPSNYTQTGPPPLVVLEISFRDLGQDRRVVPGSLIPVLFSMELAADEFLFVIVTVISVAPSPSGGLFATGSGDMRARIWRSVPFVVYISPQFPFFFRLRALIGLFYFCLVISYF